MTVTLKYPYWRVNSLFAHHCKIHIVHLVFVGIHEQEISAPPAELFRGDPRHWPMYVLTYIGHKPKPVLVNLVKVPNRTLFQPFLVETRLCLGTVISRFPQLLLQRLSTISEGTMVAAVPLQQVA